MTLKPTHKQVLKKAKNCLNKRLSLQEINNLCIALDKVLAVNQNNLLVLNLYAHYQIKNARPDLAGAAASKALLLDSKNIKAKVSLVQCFSMVGDNKKAYSVSKQLCEEQLNDVFALELIGNTLIFNNDYLSAIEIFKKLVNLQPMNSQFLTSLGSMYHYTHDIETAESILLRACRINPQECRAYWVLSQLRTVTQNDNHIDLISHQLNNPSTSQNNKVFLYFALGKEQEDLGNYTKAFTSFSRGNHIKIESTIHKVNQNANLFAIIKEQYLKTKMLEISGFSSDEPIFIVGMPRSGSTLLERVLASSPEVFAAGELQEFHRAMCYEINGTGRKFHPDILIKQAEKFDYVALGARYISLTRGRTGHTAFFIDKLPSNFLYLGFIKKALPNAKFIHIYRDPIDTCVSTYKTLFGHDMYPESYNLNTLATYYKHYSDLMEFWNCEFPTQIINVAYEDLITNPSANFNKVFDRVGLQWRDKFLNFEANINPVGTASAGQVRKPIYKSSMNKWENYQPQIDLLIRQLKGQ
jgi:tetratricopeptide (TPR) repeat protein